MKTTAVLPMMFFAASAFSADLEIKNGDFENGKQFWRGSGKVVLLPEGGKVLELKADDRYNDEVLQDFDMGKATKLEFTMRVRGIQYKGEGVKVLLQLRGSGTQFLQRAVTDSWTDIKWSYERTSPKDKYQFGFTPCPGTGLIQVDDVKITVTSTDAK